MSVIRSIPRFEDIRGCLINPYLGLSPVGRGFHIPFAAYLPPSENIAWGTRGDEKARISCKEEGKGSPPPHPPPDPGYQPLCHPVFGQTLFVKPKGLKHLYH
ncbi:hypothetical protein JOD24_000389 [Kroppenstedtia sanguinis]